MRVTVSPSTYLLTCSPNIVLSDLSYENFIDTIELPFKVIVRLLQPEKTEFPMLVTLLGIVMEVRLLQPEKALFPILVTLLGIVIEVRLLQLKKAPSLMFVTLPGIVIEVRLEQLEKALSTMLVTLFGIVMEVRPVHSAYLQLIVYQFVLIKTVEK